jgi:hypothetical protein
VSNHSTRQPKGFESGERSGVASRSGSVGVGAKIGAKMGIASFSGGGSELGTSFPLAAYQAAPLLDLPLRRGMARVVDGLGWKTQRRSRRVRCPA